MKNVLLVLAVVLLLSASIVAAQGGEAVELDEGFVITPLSGWELGEDGESYSYALIQSDNVFLLLTLPELLADLVEINGGDAPADVLMKIYDTNGWEYAAADIEVDLVDGMGYALLEFTAENGDPGYSMVVAYDNGSYAFIDYFATDESYDKYYDATETMILSLRPIEGAARASGPSEPCFVSAPAGETVAVRVGPGEHRGVFTSMAADMGWVAVSGQTEVDGARWYQLEIEGSSANELWAAAADVDSEGDCDAVGDTAAPPVIQAAPNPPPVAPDDNGNNQPPPVALPPSGGSAPMVTGVQWVGSCRGGMMPHISWVDADGDGQRVRVTQFDGSPFADLGVSGYGEATVFHDFACGAGQTCIGWAFVDDAAGNTSNPYLLTLDCE